MSQRTQRNRIHPDLEVIHSIPGRIRLRARKLYGRSQSADDIARKLSAIMVCILCKPIRQLAASP